MVGTPGVNAAAFLFAGDSNGADVIAHPVGYSGVQTGLNLSVCIAPSAAAAQDLEIPVKRAVREWNGLTPTTGNLSFPGYISSGEVDAESVMLHELGHCIGLAHPNLATESGVSGSLRNYTRTTTGANASYDLNSGADGIIGSADDSRGDDVNLFWFEKGVDNPFTLPTIVDTTTYSQDLLDLPVGETFPANGDRDVAAALGVPSSESVMQQGQFFGEVQRALSHDDVAGIRLGMSGRDETAGTADDYIVTLTYAGIQSGCDINISDTTTGFASCSAGGAFLNSGPPFFQATNHVRMIAPSIVYNESAYDWYYTPCLGDDLCLESIQPSATSPKVGENFDYVVVVRNESSVSATNVVVSAPLPAALSLVQTTGCDNDPVGSPTCSLGSLAPGATRNITFTVVVLTPPMDPALSLTATVSATAGNVDTLDDAKSVSTTVDTDSSDLTLTNMVSSDPVTSASAYSYSLFVVNGGPDTAAQVTVVNSLPAGVNLVSSAPPPGSSCNANGQDVSCAIGSLSVGADATIVLNVTAPSVQAAAMVTNSASVSSNSIDPMTSDNTATVVHAIIPNPDVDGDGLLTTLEESSCTDPLDADSDDDGLSDGAEDLNADGLVGTNETDPCNADTDGDGLQDGTELGVVAGVPDPDGDGPAVATDLAVFLPDADAAATVTDPRLADSDADGFADGVEDVNLNGAVDVGESDPTSAASIPVTAQQVPVLGLLASLGLALGLISLARIGRREGV